jgi:hypothetical protein
MDDAVALPVLFAALAVAMSARVGGLTQHQVDDLRTKAEELLPRGEGLRQAVLAFATAYEADRHDAKAMEYHGQALERAMREATGLERPRRTRADING